MASAGIGIYLHHCNMQKTSHVSLTAVESCCLQNRDAGPDDCCDTGHNKESFSNDIEKDCCNTDFEYYKIENDYKVSQEKKTVPPVITVNNQSPRADLGAQASVQKKGNVNHYFPPGSSSSPIYIRIAHLRL